jgi:hypothetical protein
MEAKIVRLEGGGFFVTIIKDGSNVASFATGHNKTGLYRKLTSYLFPELVKEPGKINKESTTKRRIE